MMRTVCALLGLWLGLFIVSPLQAVQQQPVQQQPVQQQALSRPVYQALQDSQALLAADKVSAAIAGLDGILANPVIKPYEQAVLLQSRGYAQLAREDYLAAINDFTASLELAQLPDEVQQRLRYNLAQLQLATQHYAEALRVLQQWFRLETQPAAHAYLLLGNVHLQLKQYRQALAPLRQAISISEQPREGWYRSLLGAYHELKQHDQCEQLLRSMVQLFPDTGSYWRQLAGMQMQRENYPAALATLELAYAGGHLEAERELLNLAQLYLHQGAPRKAALLLEAEIAAAHIKADGDNWELTANAWTQARDMERAVAALKLASQHGRRAQTQLRLAQLYMELKRWPEADDTLLAVLASGALDDKANGQAWLLLGIVCFENKANERARKAFAKAAVFSLVRKDAEQWLAFLDSRSGLF